MGCTSGKVPFEIGGAASRSAPAQLHPPAKAGDAAKHSGGRGLRVMSAAQAAAYAYSELSVHERGAKRSFERAASLAHVRCFQTGAPTRAPIRLVVFDFDETLTLATLRPKDFHNASQQKRERSARISFDSPWLPGRRARLAALLQRLRAEVAGAGPRRSLALLTRNQSGLGPVLGLLRLAGLESYFDVAWCMPLGPQSCAYRRDGCWTPFSPDTPASLPDHKADLLLDVVVRPDTWLPLHFETSDGSGLANLRGLRPEHILLVDDLASNFANPRTGARLPRGCLVARFQEQFEVLGMAHLGGIGARAEEDFDVLQQFVESPWLVEADL